MDFIIGSLLTLLVSVVLFLLTFWKERKQELLKREIKRIIKLEEFVGEITEWVGGYQLKYDDSELEKRMRKLALMAGQFRRYPKLKQALRDIHNMAGILISESRHGFKDAQELRDTQEELESKYKEFLNAIDSITGKRET